MNLLIRLATTVLAIAHTSTAWAVDYELSDNATSASVAGETLWTLNHDPAEGKPYFHPLAATNGTVFSALRPEDHPWHRGLWFSWKYLNGINYWEENRETGRSVGGSTRLISTEQAVDDKQSISITQILEYAPTTDAPAILDEARVISVSAPDKQGAYFIDWQSEFTARGEDVLIDRTPIIGEPNGKPFGGYAGLSVRMNHEMRQGTFTSSNGSIGKANHGQVSPWIAYGNAQGPSLLFMDHPDNLRHPSHWYVSPGMPYFSPAPVFNSPYELNAGETLNLNYRVLISPQPMSSEKANQAWENWARQSAAKKTTVAILTGSNNHAWEKTTVVLTEILENSDSCQVEVILDPEELTSEKLSEFDVLLSNWNAFGKKTQAGPWSEKLKQAYLDYVRNGGGHVVVHAGSASHYGWEDYHRVALATWGKGTGHKEKHEFPVRMVDKSHPAIQGIEDFRIHDELWFRPVVQDDATVLAEVYSKTTGEWEPTVFVGQFGEGRTYTILLGDNAWSMKNGGFQSLLTQGVIWAGNNR